MAAVKICGIKSAKDLQSVMSAGAAYAGIVFYPPSPRSLSPDEAASVINATPGLRKSATQSVAVTVDPSDDLLEDVATAIAPHYVQLHGSESLDRVREIRKYFPRLKIIKAMPVRCGDDVAAALRYRAVADMLLFDAKAPKAELPGGNGVAFDWKLLSGRDINCPWILAGGLHKQNVAEAVRLTGAKIVDVSSGVESAPGVKDAAEITAFIEAAA